MVRRASSAGPPMAPPPSTKHVQVVAGPSLEVQEPPVDEAAAAERQADVARLLSGFGHHLQHMTDHHLGYPCNLDVSLDFSVLAQLQRFCINNLGDPFVQSNFGVHSKQFEIAVLDWFARVWELHSDQYWGYVTNGGTEGNLHGLLLGRELFPDGIMYTSCESHHSIFKAARMYRVKCVRINTLVSGEMDCADLKSNLLLNVGCPAIVNANIGTTTKGAIDDLDAIISTLENCGFQDRFYIHCDAALSGLMLPFIKQAPKVTFKKPIGSVSVSGHKFLGCPVPCGVVITRREHVDVLSTDVEILSTRETTIMGSRNGHAAIFMWYALNKKGYRGIQKEVENCLRNAGYLVERLKQVGISASLNPFSNTVLFERPRDESFVHKWQLACEGNIAHVIVMPNVTIEKLNRFVEDLASKRTSWYQDERSAVLALQKI